MARLELQIKADMNEVYLERLKSDFGRRLKRQKVVGCGWVVSTRVALVSLGVMVKVCWPIILFGRLVTAQFLGESA
jgi:hypothetical protein